MAREMIERFWAKVDIGEADKCWNWTAHLSGQGGYGAFRNSAIGKMVKAHRFAFECHNGAIPLGLVVRHKCDNPKCCNPGHLELGTQKQNVADRYERGRDFHHRGSDHRRAKLSDDQVRQIRLRWAAGESQRKLAREFGISQFGIRYAMKGWAHVR